MGILVVHVGRSSDCLVFDLLLAFIWFSSIRGNIFFDFASFIII